MNVWDKVREAGALTPAVEDALTACYGERGRKAIRAVKEQRVKRYRDFFVVVGYSDEYVSDGEFCICNDFLYRGTACTHILAVRIAEILGLFEDFALWYTDCMHLPMEEPAP
jgi:predicted nucleic acid-binding Zn finger protein